jgi:hypothetical protein
MSGIPAIGLHAIGANWQVGRANKPLSFVTVSRAIPVSVCVTGFHPGKTAPLILGVPLI